jgi:hypothetical protein
MLTYRPILKKALQLTTRHKKWWILGFFVALLGNGGEYEIAFSNLKKISQSNISADSLLGFFTNNFISKNLFIYSKNLLTTNQPLTSLALLLALSGLIYLIITAQGTLIAAVFGGVSKKYRPFSGYAEIKKYWLQTRDKFWELFFANLIFKGGGLILAALISMPFIILLSSLTNLSTSASALIIGFLIFTPLAIIVSFLVKYTLIYIVAKGQDPLASFLNSLKLFQNNWLITGEIALILLVLNLLTGLAALIVSLILSFPLIAGTALIIYPLALPDGYYFTIIAWLMILTLPILGSVLAVFQYSAWTILFKKLTGRRRLHSKIARVTAAALEKVF